MLGIVVLATKEIFFNGLDVEQVDDFLQNLVHGAFRSRLQEGAQHKPSAWLMGCPAGHLSLFLSRDGWI
jgi:hypothetical protein